MSNSLATTKRTRKKKSAPAVETRTIKMSAQCFEAAITSYLYAISVLDDHYDVIDSDFGLEEDEEGMVEFDLTLVDTRQLELPL